jgi:hypothetical protein
MRPGGEMRIAQAGPVTGMVAQLLLVAGLAGAVALTGAGLSPAGWVAGIGCAAIVNAALARGLHRYRHRMAPADWVTLGRATLGVGLAALVTDSFGRHVPVAMLVSLAAVTLALDAVDGWVARRTRTGRLGAKFDGEVDAFVILVLSVYVARIVGPWVLAIGAARYAFLVAGWALPWLRAPVPPRYWRKVVAATQGIVLAVAAADVLPRPVIGVALGAALLLLAESFGRDALWLRARRPAAALRRRRLPPRVAAALTVLALLVVWAAMVAPDQPIRLTPGAFLRVPLEGLVLVALAIALPARGRRAMAGVIGPLLGLVVILKILNFGFYATFDRAFDPYQDISYAGIGSETLRASIGSADATLVIVGLVVLIVGLLVLMTLAVGRLTRLAAAHRRSSLRAVAGLGALWVCCWALGAQVAAHTPIAATTAAGLVVDEVAALRADLADHSVFAREIRQDRFAATPANRLLTGLRGKDVLLVFVESYGKVAVQGSSFSPGVDAVLDSGTQRLAAAGFSARSAFMTSATFGGISWLAHSTIQSGLLVNTPRRYDQLTASHRFTLSDAFKRAGWRTVYDVPADDRNWGPAKSFYHYDKVYDRRNVGYRGPTYAYAPMPDQYVFAALQRNELSKAHRRPLFAEMDLVSSHTPWTRIPRMTAWSQVGDGSIFSSQPADATSKDALWSDPGRVQAAYGRSIQYTMNALVSFVQRYGNRKLVLVVLGDHQPWTIVSGQQPSHDVPISVISHDPKVLRRIAGWGWNAGLRPGPRAPVWPMNAFRDRFLSAFDAPPVPRA